jgi:branched-chain amino acid transport system substrate-binding protein
MPLVIDQRRFFVGLMGLGVNNDLAYPGYFAMIPTGPDPNSALTEGFFAIAAAQSPRPKTVALLTADAEFARNPVLGARVNAARHGFTIVREANYPLKTTDFAPILGEIAATDCEVLFLSSYLDDSVELIKALRAHAFRPKIVGGAMIGPQNTSVRTALGPLLNGVVNYEYWAPVASMHSPTVEKMLDTYASRASAAGVDPLGHYMAPTAYAQMQVVAQTVQAVGSLNDDALIAHARQATFKTVMGDVRFGPGGEWSEPRVLQVQFQGIVGNGSDQFRDGSRQVVVTPNSLASGALVYPYARAL